jgi:hypothetical protein
LPVCRKAFPQLQLPFCFSAARVEENFQTSDSASNGEAAETVEPAPPKNKKENDRVGGRYYKQATPKGVFQTDVTQVR